MSGDHRDRLTRDKAETLARRIRSHWHRQGRDVTVWLEAITDSSKGEYVVRSNLTLAPSPKERRP